MRIAIIAEVYLPKVDGVVMRTMNLIRHLQQRGDEILVICPEGQSPPDSPVPVVQFPGFPFPSYPEYRIGLPDERVVSTIHQFQPDLIHYINPFAFGFRCSDLLAKAGVECPSLYSFHTLYGEFVKQYALLKPLSKLLWWLMKDYHNRADRNLTVSAVMEEDLRYRGFARVELWPPAVNCSLFDPSRRRSDMRVRLTSGQPDRPLLLTVSRLAPEKNVAFLEGVIRQYPDVCLAIIGDGPQRAELEQRFAGTSARFFGYLEGEELAAAYASADAFVYASETETMGNVILEAMASGIGVVAPRAGGIRSLVADGETGLLYEPGDSKGAASAVGRLLSDTALRERLGTEARLTVEQWGWNRAVERVRQHYEEVIAAWESGVRVPRRRQWLAPAMVSGLVLSFRVLALISGLGRSTLDRARTATRPPLCGQLLNQDGGTHEHRPEGAGT